MLFIPARCTTYPAHGKKDTGRSSDVGVPRFVLGNILDIRQHAGRGVHFTI